MRSKTFEFPSFESWNGNQQEYNQKIGAYTCVIKPTSWGAKDKKVTYAAAIANSDYPTNIYVHPIFAESIRCNPHDEKTLKKWYEAVTVKLNDRWKAFILETYFCGVKSAYYIPYYIAEKDDDGVHWHCPICNAAIIYENEHPRVMCDECTSIIIIPQ